MYALFAASPIELRTGVVRLACPQIDCGNCDFFPPPLAFDFFNSLLVVRNMARLDDYERLEISSVDELRSWLEHNNARQEGVWLVTAKKSEGKAYVPRVEILEALLAFGWVDSLPRKLDHTRTMLLISPRKSGSNWSRINKDIVARLEAEHRIMPSGRAVIEQAKKDGSWSRLDDVENLVIPADLGVALDAVPEARRHFERFPPSSRRAILEWILNARKPDTRARRITETAEKAAKNIKANHPKGRDRGPIG